ncbi:MAG TPA: hypothetical protein VJ970_06690, partial [Flavobacteriaceae bacterium]|nr:hypothetical protein [Flavobacteriaceae bacterium]
MIEFWIYLFIALVGIGLGYIIGLLKTKNKLEKQTFKAEEQLKVLLQEKERNENIINALNEDKKTLSKERHDFEIKLVEKAS